MHDYVFVGNYFGKVSYYIGDEEYTDMETGEKIMGRREMKPYESHALKKTK